MPSEWYYQDSGREVGPLSSGTLRKLAMEGAITPETPVRKAGGDKWAPARKVRGLFNSQTQSLAVLPKPIADPPGQASLPQVRPQASRPRQVTAAGVKQAQVELLRSLSMFHYVSPRAQQILQDSPEWGEVYLMHDLLSSRIPQIHSLWQDAVDGALGIMGEGCGGWLNDWAEKQSYILMPLIREMESLCASRFQEALEQPGDGQSIVSFVDEICRICCLAIEWELEIKTLLYYPQFSHLEPLMRGMTRTLIDAAVQLEQQMREQMPALPQTLRLKILINVEPTREDTRRMERLTAAIEKLPRGY